MRPDVELLFASRLDADPMLRAKVESLRRDRALLMSMPDVEAPPDLISRVEAVLERQALLGAIPGADGATAEEPESLVLVGNERPLRLAPARTREWARGRLALAAGISLLVMGGAYWSYIAIQKSLPSGPNAIAFHDTTPEVAAPEPAAETRSTPVPDEPVRIAVSPESAPVGPVAEGPVAATEPVPVEEPRLITRMAAAESSESPRVPLAELASQGRLAVHVLGTRATARVAADVLGYSESRGWRMTREAPDEAGRLLAALPPSPERARGEAPAFAGTSGIERMLTDPRPIGLPMAPSVSAAAYEPAGPTCYMVECGACDETIEALRAAITARTGRRVEFAVLEEPRQAALPLEPEAVLWWTLAPSSWTRKVTIPVLFDSR